MASTLIIADSGKIYCVTLGNPGEVVELDPNDEKYPEGVATAGAAQEMVAEGIHLAEIPATGEGAYAAAAQIIMGTFVNLPLLGDKAD